MNCHCRDDVSRSQDINFVFSHHNLMDLIVNLVHSSYRILRQTMIFSQIKGSLPRLSKSPVITTTNNTMAPITSSVLRFLALRIPSTSLKKRAKWGWMHALFQKSKGRTKFVRALFHTDLSSYINITLLASQRHNTKVAINIML